MNHQQVRCSEIFMTYVYCQKINCLFLIHLSITFLWKRVSISSRCHPHQLIFCIFTAQNFDDKAPSFIFPELGRRQVETQATPPSFPCPFFWWIVRLGLHFHFNQTHKLVLSSLVSIVVSDCLPTQNLHDEKSYIALPFISTGHSFSVISGSKCFPCNLLDIFWVSLLNLSLW